MMKTLLSLIAITILAGCDAAETNKTDKPDGSPVDWRFVDAIAAKDRPRLSNPAPLWEIEFVLRTNPPLTRLEILYENGQASQQTVEQTNTVFEVPVQVMHAWNARTTQWVTFRDDLPQWARPVTNYLSTNVVTKAR